MALGNIWGSFLHGLAFFSLSLTVIFLQYRSHRIMLSRRLNWLGIFAFCEALIAWDDLLIVLVPRLLQPVVLGIGYAHLLAFSLQTFRPDAELPVDPKQLLIGLQVYWAIVYGLAIALSYPELNNAVIASEVIIRYTLGVPGGILAAFGLRAQSYQTLDLKLREYIRPYLRVVESMMGIFGILNLFLVPCAHFFPASIINHQLVPISHNFIWAIVGIGIAVGLAKALTTVQSEIESWIEGVERIQALTTDRERISRDLHDGIIQSIYASGLLLEGVKHMIPYDPETAQGQIAKVMDNLNETIQDIRRYIFDLRSDMPDDDVLSGIQRLLRDFRVNTLLETEFETTGNPVPILSIERRRHIFQIVRETLANTAKHAQAKWVKIHLNYTAEALNLTIADDGVGMETLLVSKGYGLRNIRERARLLDGILRIESAPAQGVTVHLTVPYDRGR
ncbi:MAG: sensor histidine kinase [Anaerolineae bacterium]|nr:sensor histidine kinase [Anaerolineae bacterium]